jgi:hypothetical protein
VPQLRNTSARRTAGLVVASAALLISAAACGGGSDADSANGGGGTPEGASAFTAYTDCLKQNGVTITLPSGGPRTRPSGGAFPSGRPSGMPRPSGSARAGGDGLPGGGGFTKPEGVDDATWQKAQTACASVRPSGRPGGGGNGRGSGMNAAYRNCLQDHDVTLDQGGLNTADPAVQKAVEACKALAPSAAPSS